MKKRGLKNRKKERTVIIRKDAIILAVTFLVFILAMFNLANLTGRQVDEIATKPAGDANLDGNVSIVDSMFIAQYVNGMREFTQEQMTLSDVNSDAKVTMEDAQTIAEYMVGKIQQLPVPAPTPPTKPYVPSRVKAFSDNYSSAVILTWVDNADNEDGFKIYRVLEGTNNWVQIATAQANILTYTDKETVENTGYGYKVESYNSVGDSIQGSSTHTKTNALMVSTPTNIEAITTNPNEAKISWNDTYNEIGYKLERKKENIAWAEIANLPADSITYIDKPAEAGYYCYRIKSYNATESSQASAEACINIVGCANECSLNDKKCGTTTTYQTCGNYDQDMCLEWGTPQNCNTEQSCNMGICTNNTAEICDNGIDDDKDSFKDSLDSDCITQQNQQTAQTTVFEICNNKIDDDNDKLIDSLDPDCAQTYSQSNDWNSDENWQEYSWSDTWEDSAWEGYNENWQTESQGGSGSASEGYSGSENWRTETSGDTQADSSGVYGEQNLQPESYSGPNEDIEEEVIEEEIAEIPEAPSIYSCEGYLIGNKYTIVNLEWEDNSGNEEKYRIDADINDKGWKTMRVLPADSTNYVHVTKTKLEKGTTVKIRIAAQNKNGSSISNKCILNT